MPHRIDIDGINRNLFILKHLAAGSQAICRDLCLDRAQDGPNPFGWHYYLGWLKSITCETLIETAVKFRILQDLMSKNDQLRDDLKRIEGCIADEFVVGRFAPSNQVVSIREACNKILHADSVVLVWLDANDGRPSYEFWNGMVNLDGLWRGEPWSCQLSVPILAEAMEHFLFEVEEKINWSDIYYFDE